MDYNYFIKKITFSSILAIGLASCKDSSLVNDRYKLANDLGIKTDIPNEKSKTDISIAKPMAENSQDQKFNEACLSTIDSSKNLLLRIVKYRLMRFSVHSSNTEDLSNWWSPSDYHTSSEFHEGLEKFGQSSLDFSQRINKHLSALKENSSLIESLCFDISSIGYDIRSKIEEIEKEIETMEGMSSVELPSIFAETLEIIENLVESKFSAAQIKKQLQEKNFDVFSEIESFIGGIQAILNREDIREVRGQDYLLRVQQELRGYGEEEISIDPWG